MTCSFVSTFGAWILVGLKSAFGRYSCTVMAKEDLPVHFQTNAIVSCSLPDSIDGKVGGIVCEVGSSDG